MIIFTPFTILLFKFQRSVYGLKLIFLLSTYIFKSSVSIPDPNWIRKLTVCVHFIHISVTSTTLVILLPPLSHIFSQVLTMYPSRVQIFSPVSLSWRFVFLVGLNILLLVPSHHSTLMNTRNDHFIPLTLYK